MKRVLKKNREYRSIQLLHWQVRGCFVIEIEKRLFKKDVIRLYTTIPGIVIGYSGCQIEEFEKEYGMKIKIIEVM